MDFSWQCWNGLDEQQTSCVQDQKEQNTRPLLREITDYDRSLLKNPYPTHRQGQSIENRTLRLCVNLTIFRPEDGSLNIKSLFLIVIDKNPHSLIHLKKQCVPVQGKMKRMAFQSPEQKVAQIVSLKRTGCITERIRIMILTYTGYRNGAF